MKQNIMGSWRCCLLRVCLVFLQPFDQAFVSLNRQQNLQG